MRVLVAMSGGVDSSVAAALLKAAGHEVVGTTLRVYASSSAASCGRCCSPDDVDDARAVARQLGIPFYVANVEALFQEKVVTPFVQSYLKGRTPIPCVACNEEVKFGFLLNRARQLGAKLATGHYARVLAEGERFELWRALDHAKDQSYFLFTLGQAELQDVLFPLGELTKPEVRALAERHQLKTSAKPESMEICFVPDGDYASFVERIAGPQPGGDIVSPEGKVLGRHSGIHRFTVGQRRGLQVAGPTPLYVQRIDPATHAVVVGPASATRERHLRLLAPHWVSEAPSAGARLSVKIRHRHPGADGWVRRAPDGGVEVELCEPQQAVTPGQAAVLYDGDRVLGGGWIA